MFASKLPSVNESHKKLWFFLYFRGIILSIKEVLGMNFKSKIKKAYRESDKKTLVVYIILRTLDLITFIRQIILGEVSKAILCLFTLVLLIIPFFIEKKFKITIPSFLEILLLLIIFTSTILGEINNFYVRIPHVDTVMHTLNGFLSAGIGFSLVYLLNQHVDLIKLSPLFVAIVSFCFSMTVGILWEFYEFGFDMLFKTDMQKDTLVHNIATVELDDTKTNNAIKIKDIDKTVLYNKDNEPLAAFTGYLDIGIIDTMKDLIVNFIGSLTFSIIGYLYIKNKEKYRFANNFILTKQIDIIKEES